MPPDTLKPLSGGRWIARGTGKDIAGALDELDRLERLCPDQYYPARMKCRRDVKRNRHTDDPQRPTRRWFCEVVFVPLGDDGHHRPPASQPKTPDAVG